MFCSLELGAGAIGKWSVHQHGKSEVRWWEEFKYQASILVFCMYRSKLARLALNAQVMAEMVTKYSQYG